MFVLKASVWLKALEQFRPDIAQTTQQAWQQRSTDAVFIRPGSAEFKAIPSESIDYAFMERCPGSNFPSKWCGNIDALRDWGHAKDYVRMQWMMLQQEKADDFVIATGVQYSVRQFINWTAEAMGMQLRWEGQVVNAMAYAVNLSSTRNPSLPVVRIDSRYFRPTEVETLLGDPSKAKQKLGWSPEITVQQMCAEMAKQDLAEAKRIALLNKHGYHVNLSVE